MAIRTSGVGASDQIETLSSGSAFSHIDTTAFVVQSGFPITVFMNSQANDIFTVTEAAIVHCQSFLSAMTRLQEVTYLDGVLAGYKVKCPGCGKRHFYRIFDPHNEYPTWKFNGDPEKPTFTPSYRHQWHDNEKGKDDPQKGDMCCHFFLTDGIFDFCGDCTHDLSGQKSPMVQFLAIQAVMSSLNGYLANLSTMRWLTGAIIPIRTRQLRL